jgi:flagellar protein FlaJ
MELKKTHKIGLIIAGAIVISSFFLMGTRFFLFLFGIGIIVGITPIVLSVMSESKRDAEKEEVFLEFARNLVESVKSGTPISKSIINLKERSYGVLSPHIQKLGNQISLGIPLRTALNVFAKDVKNKTISRSLVLIGQAEQAGGEIGQILDSVAEAVSMSDKLKKERKSSIQNLVVQGYIIFFVFIAIVLIMQFKIVPMVAGMSNLGSTGGIGLGIGVGGGTAIGADEISGAFLYLLLIQGLFTGLTIGKLSEGNMKAGIKHSFALTLMSFLISTGASILIGA